MIKNSVFNNPDTYAHGFCETLDIPLPGEPVFAVQPNEWISHTHQYYDGTPLDEIVRQLDEVDAAVLEEIGRSKHLTSLQIYQFLSLRGYTTKRPNLRKRLLRLMKVRLIQENELHRSGSDRGIKYYELEWKGYLFVKERGISFHMGNRFLPYSKKVEIGAIDTVTDVKRILVGNQIVIGMLMNRARIQRFGIMETFCVDNTDLAEKGCIIRTAANIKIDEDSILAYEVVRDTPESYAKVADKVSRYYTLLDQHEYLNANHHGDIAFPQLVLCGENLAHNRKISRFLVEQGLHRPEDPILFTEDLLNIKDSLHSLYEIKGETLVWYQIPGKEPEYRFVAAR